MKIAVIILGIMFFAICGFVLYCCVRVGAQAEKRLTPSYTEDKK